MASREAYTIVMVVIGLFATPLILHWLESKLAVRSAIAEKHHKRFGVTPTED